MIRLNKRLSELGFCSRREADQYIAQGLVLVNGKVCHDLGTKVLATDQIELAGLAQRNQAKLVTVILNKPIGFVSAQPEDNYPPAITLLTPANFFTSAQAKSVYPTHASSPRDLQHLPVCGRLDIDSQGLLVFSQDGRIARQLIGPESRIEKEYLVRVAKTPEFSEARIELLRHGLSLDGKVLLPAQARWINADQLQIVLQEGRHRQVRRMCEAIGLRVLGLKRVRIGKLRLGNLPEGQWRYLDSDEVFS